MSILHRCIRLFALALLLSVGIALLTLSLSPRNWQVLTDWVTDGRIDAIWVGLATLAFALLFGLTGIRLKPAARFLRLEGENGPVNISTQAIADYVLKTGSEFPMIVKMKPVITAGRRSIDVLIELRVKAGPKIQETCERLQQRIRESIRNELGITQIRRVEVSIREIIAPR